MVIRSNANLVYDCTYHVVWCPKYRRPLLVDPVDAHLKRIVHEVVAERGAWTVELEIMPDHVHLLVECDPQLGIHKLVKAIKGRSSRDLRAEYPHLRSRIPTLWTNSYFVATAGGAPLEVIKRYVANQRNA